MRTQLGLLVRRYHATSTRADLNAGTDQLRAAVEALPVGAPGERSYDHLARWAAFTHIGA